MAKDSGTSAATAAANKKAKMEKKEERQTTKEDHSRSRMKNALPLLVPVFSGLFSSSLRSPPTYVELASPSAQQLHTVFFSGQPHLVFCTNSTGNDVHRMVGRVSDAALELATATASKDAAITAAIAKSAKGKKGAKPVQQGDEFSYPELSPLAKSRVVREGVVYSPLGGMRVVTLDCEAPLPSSGQTVLSRFKMTLPPPVATGAPPAFYVAGGSKPTWVPSDLFSGNGEPGENPATQLLNHVESKMMPRTTALYSEKVLNSACTSLKHCVVILHSGVSSLSKRATTSSIRAIHEQLPFAKVVTLDVLKYTLAPLQNSTILGELEGKQEQEQEWPRLVYFRRQANKIAGPSASTLLMKPYKGRFLPSPIVAFLSSLADSPKFHPETGAPIAAPAATAAAPAATTGAASMTPLEKNPWLNTGANNFNPPVQPRTREELDAARKERAAARAVKADSSASEARRREQMEAEAAEANFVREATPDDNMEASEDGEQAVEDAEEDEAVDLDE